MASMASSSPPGPWLDAWLSAPRFATYLAAAGGDRRRAFDLYEWNARVAGAFFRDLAHLEVALRNAYDTAIVTHTAPSLPHWTQDPYRLFPVQMRTANDGTQFDANATARKQLQDAARKIGANQPPGKTIAELSFGFWRYLSTGARHTPLWIPYLHHAFTPGTSRPAVDRPVADLHRFRNRIAHHEPLLRWPTATAQPLRDRYADIITIAGLISSDLRDYLAHTSTVLTTITSAGLP